VQGLVDAALDADAGRAIAMTDPEEMRALYDYAPLFLPDVARSAQGARDEDDFAVKVDRLDTSVDGDGSVRRIRITGFDVTLGSQDDNVHMVYDGTCYDVTTTYSSSFEFGSYDPETGDYTSTPSTGAPEVDHEHVCAGDPSSESSDGPDSSGDASLFGGLGMFGSASAQPFAVTVTEVDGRWYVSPVRTILDSVVEGLRALQPDDVQTWGDLFGGSAAPERFESVGSAVTDDPTSIDPGITAPSYGGGSSSIPSTSTTDPIQTDGHASADDLLWTQQPSTLARVHAACAGPIAFYEETSDSDLIGSYVAARDVVACAASVVPAYVPCVPTVDAVIAHLRNGSDESAAEDEMWACLDDVSG
jgi:hypothetical protein